MVDVASPLVSLETEHAWILDKLLCQAMQDIVANRLPLYVPPLYQISSAHPSFKTASRLLQIVVHHFGKTAELHDIFAHPDLGSDFEYAAAPKTLTRRPARYLRQFDHPLSSDDFAAFDLDPNLLLNTTLCGSFGAAAPLTHTLDGGHASSDLFDASKSSLTMSLSTFPNKKVAEDSATYVYKVTLRDPRDKTAIFVATAQLLECLETLLFATQGAILTKFILGELLRFGCFSWAGMLEFRRDMEIFLLRPPAHLTLGCVVYSDVNAKVNVQALTYSQAVLHKLDAHRILVMQAQHAYAHDLIQAADETLAPRGMTQTSVRIFTSLCATLCDQKSPLVWFASMCNLAGVSDMFVLGQTCLMTCALYQDACPVVDGSFVLPKFDPDCEPTQLSMKTFTLLLERLLKCFSKDPQTLPNWAALYDSSEVVLAILETAHRFHMMSSSVKDVLFNSATAPHTHDSGDGDDSPSPTRLRRLLQSMGHWLESMSLFELMLYKQRNALATFMTL